MTIVFDLSFLVKAKPESRSLDQLIVDMDVEKFSNSTNRVTFRLPDIDGIDVGISDYKGKIVFLNFWATWCPSCVVEMPAMERLHRRLKDKDFVMVAVSIQESASDVQRFFKQHKLSFTALLDSTGKTVPGFGIRAIPTTLILDKNGRIFGRIMGPRKWDSRESIAMFQQLVDRYAPHATMKPADPS